MSVLVRGSSGGSLNGNNIIIKHSEDRYYLGEGVEFLCNNKPIPVNDGEINDSNVVTKGGDFFIPYREPYTIVYKNKILETHVATEFKNNESNIIRSDSSFMNNEKYVEYINGKLYIVNYYIENKRIELFEYDFYNNTTTQISTLSVDGSENLIYFSKLKDSYYLFYSKYVYIYNENNNTFTLNFTYGSSILPYRYFDTPRPITQNNTIYIPKYDLYNKMVTILTFSDNIVTSVNIKTTISDTPYGNQDMWYYDNLNIFLIRYITHKDSSILLYSTTRRVGNYNTYVFIKTDVYRYNKDTGEIELYYGNATPRQHNLYNGIYATFGKTSFIINDIPYSTYRDSYNDPSRCQIIDLYGKYYSMDFPYNSTSRAMYDSDSVKIGNTIYIINNNMCIKVDFNTKLYAKKGWVVNGIEILEDGLQSLETEIPLNIEM